MPNSSSITHFLLLALADTWELQLLHFWLLLGIYLAALMANGLIITTVICDHCLHTPMYFFPVNLFLLNLGSIPTTFPKAIANSLWDTWDISYAGCVAQVFLFLFSVSAAFSLLTVMAYDRYAAICQPLSSSSPAYTPTLGKFGLIEHIFYGGWDWLKFYTEFVEDWLEPLHTTRHCTFLVHQGNLGASVKLGIAFGQGLSLELPEEEFLVGGRDAKA
ncbi:olfactory receptor 14I1-like [Falco cherrug]|uniref:olfactory receptor 14I1-like n=1 Tax=Falco cherrug TaxID=345164 RepID=UPI002478507B|nr:olfactory receptor 14I1-like [Falco cherrug]